MNYSGKKVLIFGLGVHGGGAASAIFFGSRNASVRVTDLRDETVLANSISKIKSANIQAEYTLGENKKEDIEWADILVVNPGARLDNQLLLYAKESGKHMVNEAVVFFDNCPSEIIAVTGTRGKTTTVNWITQLWRHQHPNTVLTGNSSDNPMLQALETPEMPSPIITELSSFHLELLDHTPRSPHVAVITNLSPDHLNRYESMEAYAATKANIFINQTSADHLILHGQNEWTPFFIKQKPKSNVWFIQPFGVYKTTPGLQLDMNKNLIFVDQDLVQKTLWNIRDFAQTRGEHNVQNLLMSLITTYLSGMDWEKLETIWNTVTDVKYRQETIFTDKSLQIINDTTATSPEGAIAAFERFKETNIVLIAGGADKNLDFKTWAQKLKETVNPEHVFLLDGSATKKMITALEDVGVAIPTSHVIGSFEPLVRAAFEKTQNLSKQGFSTLLFSPGAASFEKFLHEFDRGDKFNGIVKDLVR